MERCAMKLRIAIWAGVGVLIAGAWAVYAFTRSQPITPAEPVVWHLVLITQPFLLATLPRIGIRWYWFLLANAATYALLGLIVESLRRQLQLAR